MEQRKLRIAMFLLFVVLASKERVTSVRGKIHVRAKTRRKGKHVRGEDTHAQSRSSAKQNDLLRGFLVLSSRPQWPAAATFPPRVFAPLSFSFSSFQILFQIFPSSCRVKKSTPLLFFFFFGSKIQFSNVIDFILVSSMFRRNFNESYVQITYSDRLLQLDCNNIITPLYFVAKCIFIASYTCSYLFIFNYRSEKVKVIVRLRFII